MVRLSENIAFTSRPDRIRLCLLAQVEGWTFH